MVRRDRRSRCAAEHLLGRALRVDGERAVLALVDGGHEPQRRVEADRASAAGALGARRDVDAELARGLEQADLGRLAARLRSLGPDRARRCCTRRAPGRAARAPGSRPRQPRASPSPSRSSSPSGVQIRLPASGSRSACRSCRCRSQSAEPSVSTALSRLTRAPRRASVATPTASASVIVGSSPSGTLATIRPIAKLNASFERQPGDEPADRQEREADEDRDERDQPRHAAHLALERARLGLDPLGERGDPAELRSAFRSRRRAPSPRRRRRSCR